MPSSFPFDAIGTRWQIDIFDELEASRAACVLEKVHARIAEFDAVYSRFRRDSLVARMATHAGAYRLPDDAERMLSLYERLYRVTDGACTPLIGQMLVDAGYDAEYSLQAKELHASPAWNDVFAYTHPILTMKQPALLDFGAAGKGYLIDLVVELLRAEGVSSFCVDAGGDMRAVDPQGNSLRVGLEHPERTNEAIGVVALANASMCGSAGNRRAWGDFHHVINPKTRSSPRHILAVWVVADTAMLADAMTTCLFFVPPERLLAEFTFSYLLVYADHSARASADFPGELFS